MAIDEQVKLAFASVADLTKQLITLGTAVLTLEASFAKAYVPAAVAKHWQAPVSWILLLLSVAAGIWALMALTGTLAKAAELKADLLYKRNIQLPAMLQTLLFAAGMVLSIWFGAMASS